MSTRVLYVIDSLAPGGAETSLAAFAPLMLGNNIDLHVLTLGRVNTLEPTLINHGVPVHRATRFGRRNNFSTVRQTALSLRPSLVHTTLFEADISGRLAARTLSIPVTTSLVSDSYNRTHQTESPNSRILAARAADTATAQLATGFHALTNAIAETVPRRLLVRRREVEVIPRGRNPRDYRFRSDEWRHEVRKELALPGSSHVILAIGRMEPQKGLEGLIQAMPRVTDQIPDARLVIAGREGRSSRALERLAHTLRVPVQFLGHREDIPRLLAAADVLCFPSKREGFGAVLIEAMATGTPIVATAIPTSREVLAEGEYGVLVPPDDPHSLSSHLALCLLKPPVAAELERARDHFLRNFSVESTSRLMANFFTRHAENYQGISDRNGS